MQEDIEKYYQEMENELLLNIAKKISADKPMEIDKWDLESNAPIVGSGGVNEWQLERLKELNGLNSENAKIIAKYSGKTIEQIEKIFQRAKEIGTAADEEMLKMGIKAGVLNEVNPKYEDIIVKDIVNRAAKNTITTFNDINNSLLASAGDKYRKIVNNVSSQVMSGMKTIDKAMQEAVSELAEEGLTGFIAKNGANWSSEAYIKMVLRANSQNTINNIQEERLKLRGCDYVEISSHSGARPLCADDQGQVFSLSGNTEPITDGTGKTIKVRSWSSSSYGKPAGILGINCGHTRYGFVPGLSIHRENKISRSENDKEYIEQQHQILYERSIRNKKREIEMLKVSNASEDYIKLKKEQLRNYNNQYKSFLKETGRYRRSANEWIDKTIGSDKTKTYEKYKKWQEKEEKRKLPKTFKKESVKLQSTFNYDKITIIPRNVEIENVVTISGSGTNSNIRDIKRLVSTYGGENADWEKVTGTIKGKTYSYEVHWYELNGKQYDMKTKGYPKENKKDD